MLAAALAACATLPRTAFSDDAQIRGALGRCGVHGAVAYDSAAGLVTVTPRGLPTARATRCAARTLLDRGLDFRSPDLALAERYAAAWQQENARVGPRMARLWVRKNLKAEVPRFAPRRETLGAYVHKLERLCAAQPGNVVVSTGTVHIPWLLDPAANDGVSCVYLAALASNLVASGVRIDAAKSPPGG